MTDLLIRLYDLPDFSSHLQGVAKQGIIVRRARVYEKSQVAEWVRKQFGQGWADECEAAFRHQPVSCFIATAKGGIVGFACHDCTCRDFFGPVGVLESATRKGIGTALLAKSLHAMADMGYAYAIVGDGGEAEAFYSRLIEVQPIPDSTPGIYADRISTD